MVLIANVMKAKASSKYLLHVCGVADFCSFFNVNEGIMHPVNDSGILVKEQFGFR
jgi:hypothetical protein